MFSSTKMSLVPTTAIILNLVISIWFITAGSWVIFRPSDEGEGKFLYAQGEATLSVEGAMPRGFARFFDAQGQAIFSGRLDVPCTFIGQEAFIVDGRCYGYFGITPAIPRLCLNFLFPKYWGQWTIVSMLTASFVFLISAYGLVLNARRYVFRFEPSNARFAWMGGLFLLALGLGGSNIFLLSRPTAFHEAIIWSCALALCSMFFAVRHLVTGNQSSVVLMSITALFAMHTRPIAGIAAVLFCVLVPFLRTLNSQAGNTNKRTKIILTALSSKTVMTGVFAGTLIVISYLGINFSKFGFGTIDQPIRYNVQFPPARLANIDGSLFHIGNLRWNLKSYFGFDGVYLRGSFPYLLPSFSKPNKEYMHLHYPEARIDGFEPYMGIPVAMSALLVLTLCGIVACRRYRPQGTIMLVLFGSAVSGGGLMLFFGYTSYRYFHEFMLLFALAGSVGVNLLSTISVKSSSSRMLGTMIAFLTAVSILLNLEFALAYQINNTNVGPAIPEMQDRFDEIKAMLRPIWH
jgi:hypothetical protein